MLLATTESNFLVPNGTFIAELIIFIIVLGIMAKFVLPPLQKVMDDRTNTIRSFANASDEGHAEAARLEHERNEIIDHARQEARVIVDAANREVDALIAAARERGTQEHDRLVENAQPQIEAERSRVRNELLGDLDELVVAAASSIVESPVDLSQHRGLMDDVMSERARVGGGK